jgi:hypothetical protein
VAALGEILQKAGARQVDPETWALAEYALSPSVWTGGLGGESGAGEDSGPREAALDELFGERGARASFVRSRSGRSVARGIVERTGIGAPVPGTRGGKVEQDEVGRGGLGGESGPGADAEESPPPGNEVPETDSWGPGGLGGESGSGEDAAEGPLPEAAGDLEAWSPGGLGGESGAGEDASDLDAWSPGGLGGESDAGED